MEEKFKNLKKKKTLCNCICCKFCNEYWREYKPLNKNSYTNEKVIKYKKKYYCEYDCYNCKKYIQKKKKQWELYLITRDKEQLEENEKSKNNSSIINIDKDDKKEILTKIKNIKQNEFSKIQTKKDGNCIYYAILKSIKSKEIRHLELRQITADYIESINYEEEEEIFKEENCQNKVQYLNKIKKNGEYTNSIVLEAISKKVNMIIAVFLADERYKENPWIIFEPNNENKIKGILFLHLEQGDPKGTGHYSGIKLFKPHNIGSITFNDFKKANSLNSIEQNQDIEMAERHILKTLIFNCRSIRDYYKKIMLVDILRSNEIDIALLQETFLIEEDKLYIEGYKIYRADNQIRRKGVAILINTKLDVECIKLAADPNGDI